MIRLITIITAQLWPGFKIVVKMLTLRRKIEPRRKSTLNANIKIITRNKGGESKDLSIQVSF